MSTQPGSGPPLMLLAGVAKVYGAGEISVRALRGVDLRVDRGDYVAIMGSSGSGKSTLMNIIGCLDAPSEGRYFLERLDVAQLEDHELSFIRSRRIGLVFQSFNLIPRTSVLRNVELPLVYQRVKAKERHDRAVHACELVGLGNRMHHIPSELSGGQQQRAAIARAIVTDPAIVLADEPTGNLDTVSTLEVLQIFADLNAAGRTIVMITHEHDVAAHAKRIIALADGEVISDERHAPLAGAPPQPGIHTGRPQVVPI
jgi:putative ABC transport system ATP-binding protein